MLEDPRFLEEQMASELDQDELRSMFAAMTLPQIGSQFDNNNNMFIRTDCFKSPKDANSFLKHLVSKGCGYSSWNYVPLCWDGVSETISIDIDWYLPDDFRNSVFMHESGHPVIKIVGKHVVVD